jgi:hypothetical protein
MDLPLPLSVIVTTRFSAIIPTPQILSLCGVRLPHRDGPGLEA